MRDAWDKELIFDNGDSYYQGFLRSIELAQKTVTLEMYIFADDSLGQRVVDSLITASHRGVKVRLLLDGIGSMDWPDRFWWALKSAGVEVRIYRPLPWAFDWLHRQGEFSLDIMGRLLARMNGRNHRKVLVVDGNVAWLGSLNVTEEHLPSVMGDAAWRDTGVAIRGSLVHWLTAAFEEAWRDPGIFALGNIKKFARQIRLPLKRDRASLLRLNFRRRLRRFYFRDLIRRINQADERVWLVTPYFVPNLALLAALRKAAKRKVLVKIMVPAISDVWVNQLAATAFYGTLLSFGVRIFEYQPSVLHAKIVIVDDWIMVGSSNLNSRSLIHDLEVDVVVTKPENKQMILDRYLVDMKNSKEVSLSQWRKRSFLNRLLSRLVLWIRYWL